MRLLLASSLLVILLCSVCFGLWGCAAGSATAGYSLAAKSADELSPQARKAIVDEAVAKMKAEQGKQ
jgi:hypothetical protein